MDLLRPTVFFRPKTISNVAIIKTTSAIIAFFSSPPFFLLAVSFSPFFFLRWCNFGAYEAPKNLPLTPFYSTDCTFGFLKKSARYLSE